MQIAAAVFENREDVKRAVDALQEAGIPGDDIGLVMRETPDEHYEEVEAKKEAPVAGAALGSVLGGAGGWWAAGLAATAVSLAVPAVGAVLAIGALAGVTAGGAVGWLAGELMSRGLHEPEAMHYQRAVERGAVVLTVNVPNQRLMDLVMDIIHAAGGHEYQPGDQP